MILERLLLIGLATWYISYALTSTHGPGGLFEWVREHVPHGRHGFDDAKFNSNTGTALSPPLPLKNGLLDCPICLAVWVALILWFLPDGIVLWALAGAGLAMLLHGYSGWRFGG